MERKSKYLVKKVLVVINLEVEVDTYEEAIKLVKSLEQDTRFNNASISTNLAPFIRRLTMEESNKLYG